MNEFMDEAARAELLTVNDVVGRGWQRCWDQIAFVHSRIVPLRS